MTRTLVGMLLFSSIGYAGTLGNQSIAVDCAFSVTITATSASDGLILDPGDPIFSKTCPGTGLSFRNTVDPQLDSVPSFTLDCNHAGTIRGSGKGNGIALRGPQFKVYNCTVDGFGTGIAAGGDGDDLENNVVQNSTGDGFYLHRPRDLIHNENFLGVFVVNDQALNNGHFGFRFKGGGFYVSGANHASGNTLGGYSMTRGVGNSFDQDGPGNDNYATDNGGPGFYITSVGFDSCCIPVSVAHIQAQNNAGAGVVYVGRFGCECNATLPECLQDGCLPVYFSALSVTASGNSGTCPRGTAPLPPGGDGQICIGATNCTGRDYLGPAC